MALDVNKLKTELLKLIDPNDAHFVGHPTNATDFATNWSNAYDTYAKDAQDVSTDPVIAAPTHKAAMKARLLTLNVPVGVIATAASTFDQAFADYWTGATFAILVAPTPAAACASVGGTGLWSAEASSVVSAVTAHVLEASMLSLLAIPSDDPQVKATALANAFHAATTSAVKVTITGTDTTAPPTGPLTITNTCGIT
jgi:hypothetical protein